jgi:hypothetical protein
MLMGRVNQLGAVAAGWARGYSITRLIKARD